MKPSFRLLLLSAPLLCPVALSNTGPAMAAGKPKLSLKGSPELGSPSTIFSFRGVLEGVEDSEAFYCLTAEWIWEEQADSSLNETECPPFVAGETKVDRVFTEEQSFRRPGTHFVKLVVRKGDREIASAGATVRVRPER